jgi:hypothetical protein
LEAAVCQFLSVGEIGNAAALSCGIETPAVIGAFQFTTNNRTLTELDLAVKTAVFYCPDSTSSIPVEGDRLLPEGDTDRLSLNFVAAGYDVPMMGIDATGANVGHAIFGFWILPSYLARDLAN